MHDEATANWVVRKIMEARQYRLRVEAWAAAEIQRAESQEQSLWRRFSRELENWTQQELLRRRQPTKSLPLPAGTLGFRSTPSRLLVTDESILARWCETHLPTAVRLSLELAGPLVPVVRQYMVANYPTVRCSEQVLRKELDQYFRKSGEVPDGCAVTDSAPRFFLK